VILIIIAQTILKAIETLKRWLFALSKEYYEWVGAAKFNFIKVFSSINITWFHEEYIMLDYITM
jgi:hypothetical protein